MVKRVRPSWRATHGGIKTHYKGPELHGGKSSDNTLRTEDFDEVTCEKCQDAIEKRGLRERPDIADGYFQSSNVQAYVDEVDGSLKKRLNAASEAMLERNAQRRRLGQETVDSVISGRESLSFEEAIVLVELGSRIILSLSCDANGDGLPCRTDRFTAMGDMIRYLDIAMEAKN